MFCDQKSKVGVLCLFLRILVAVAVYGYDTVGVLVYHDTVRVHTEGTDIVLKLMGTVDDLALIEFIGQMREDDCGHLHTDADVHTVRLGWDV